MHITDQTTLVNGADRGIGRQFVLELLERGASKIYAGVRRPETADFDEPRVVPHRCRGRGRPAGGLGRVRRDRRFPGWCGQA